MAAAQGVMGVVHPTVLLGMHGCTHERIAAVELSTLSSSVLAEQEIKQKKG